MRRLFTILAALSLLLFLAVVVMWVRSHWVRENIHSATQWHAGGETRCVYISYSSEHGSCTMLITADTLPGTSWAAFAPTWDYSSMPATGSPSHILWLPIVHRLNASQGSWWEIALDYWSLCVLLAILPAGWLVGRYRSSRRKTHCCRSCGYDLRATPERCPECGALADAGRAR